MIVVTKHPRIEPQSQCQVIIFFLIIFFNCITKYDFNFTSLYGFPMQINSNPEQFLNEIMSMEGFLASLKNYCMFEMPLCLRRLL